MKVSELISRASCICLALLITACGGGVIGTGDGSDSGTGDDIGTGSSFVEYQGQALLGAVVESTVHVYDFSAVEPSCTATTQSSTNLSQAGLFTFTGACIRNASLFKVTVSGGVNIDTDNDLVIDEVPTPIEGSFSAILTGAQIDTLAWKVSAVTDIVARTIRYLQERGLAEDRVVETIDVIAPLILKEDLNADGVINGDDIILWNPQTHGSALKDPALIDSIIQEIEAGVEINDIDMSGQIIGQLLLSGNVRLIKVLDDTAYVVSSDDSSSATLSMIDVSDGSNPNLMGSYSTQLITDLSVDESFVYLALGEHGLEIVDVSDQSLPVQVGSSSTKVDRLTLSSDVLLAASVDSEQALLHRVDVSNPEAPEFLASVALGSGTYISGLSVVGDQALLSIVHWQTVQSRIHVVDMSNPNLLDASYLETLYSLTVSDISISDTTVHFSALDPHYLNFEPSSDGGVITVIFDEAGVYTLDLDALNTTPGAFDGSENLNLMDADSNAFVTGSIDTDINRLYSYAPDKIDVRNRFDFSIVENVILPEIKQGPVGSDVDFVVINNIAYIALQQYGLVIVQLTP